MLYRMLFSSVLVALIVIPQAAKSAVSQSQLSELMQSLWNVDTNRFRIGTDIKLNLQGKTTLYSNVDQAPGRLFATVPGLTKKSTYKKFISLLDNYISLTHKTDKASPSERTEQNTFINSILGTRVWHEAKEFLIEQGLVRSSLELSNELHRIWFTEWSRAKGLIGTSGFEHVFVGELNEDKQQISGLHNWVAAYLLESSRTINYQGYIHTGRQNNIYEIKLRQDNYTKSGSTMFIGTSPEFEMAVYTVCFLTRKNQECNFVMNGVSVTIQVYASYNNVLSTAYPKL